MRSKWKGLLVNKGLEYRQKVAIKERGLVVPDLLMGRRITVYNGRKDFSYIVRKEMVGHKFGEFAMTKALGAIHQDKKKKKGGRRSKNKKG
jgi:ribosomal protein S19